MNKIQKILLILPIYLLMNGCVDQEKNKLDNRVKDFWGYKINRDFVQAYQFLSPGWRSNESENSFANRMNRSVANWLNIKLESKQCSEKNVCTVKVEVEYEYYFRGAVSKKMKVKSTIKESWIMKDNIWYNIPLKQKIGKR